MICHPPAHQRACPQTLTYEYCLCHLSGWCILPRETGLGISHGWVDRMAVENEVCVFSLRAERWGQWMAFACLVSAASRAVGVQWLLAVRSGQNQTPDGGAGRGGDIHCQPLSQESQTRRGLPSAQVGKVQRWQQMRWVRWVSAVVLVAGGGSC